MKRKITISLVALLLGLWMNPVEAADINGHVRKFANENARDYVIHTDGTLMGTRVSWYQGSNYNGILVRVEDASGQVVFEGQTGSQAQSETPGDFTVENLPVGTYTVSLVTDEVPITVSADSAITYQPKTTTVTITSDNQKVDLYWMLVSRSRRITAISKRGEFPNNSIGKNQDDESVSYRIWYSGKDGTYVFSSNNRDFVSFYGALQGDTIGMYTDVTTVPTLTEAEKAYGWTFKGWRINGSDKVYSADEILQHRIDSNIILEAAWEAPSHKVTFATDSEKGSISNQSSVTYTVEGNVSTISSVLSNTLPEVTAKDGYTFLGWYVDPTTNIVDSSDILATKVTKDLVYYAKYKKNTTDITIGENGNWIIDGVDTGKPSRGETGATGATGQAGKDGSSITVVKTDFDDNGNTVVTFSDGSVTTILKGADGLAGKDGKDGQDGSSIAITSTTVNANGDTIVTFSDGTSITIPKGKDGTNGKDGVDGKDGASLTIVKTEIDGDGNTVLYFSDGNQAVINKGTDGKDGKSISVVETQTDANGNTIITFSDTTSVLITKGADGKDGQSTSVTIGDNGNWVVDGKDTGIPARGEIDGKDPATNIERFVSSVLPKTGTELLSYLTILGAGIGMVCAYLAGRRKGEQKQ